MESGGKNYEDKLICKKMRLTSTPQNVEQHEEQHKNLDSVTKQIPLRYEANLTELERNEILNHDIYFLGNVSKHQNWLQNSILACGSFNYYQFRKNDHIKFRYEMKLLIGFGATGQVIKAFDHKDKKLVAIKNTRRSANNYEEELKVLKYLRENDRHDEMNIVHLIDDFTFRGHNFMVFPLMENNLHSKIQQYGMNGHVMDLMKMYCRHLLKSLKKLNEAGIIHCDLKPQNMVLDTNSNDNKIRIIDFGLSCFINGKKEVWVQTRPYRAPEIILHLNYGPEIDIWSLGCSLVQLCYGFNIFTARVSANHIAEITEIIGKIPDSMLNQCDKVLRDKLFTEDGTPVMSTPGNKYGPPASKPLNQILQGCSDELFIDFITKCLIIDPKERITPSKGLEHPWLS